MGEGDGFLGAGGQVFHLCHAIGDVVVAQDDGGAGAGTVGALHPPLGVASVGHFGADAVGAEGLQDVDGDGLYAQINGSYRERSAASEIFFID